MPPKTKLNCVTLRSIKGVVVSGSVSLDNTFPVTGLSSLAVPVSLLATGGWSTGETYIVNVAVSVPPFPSLKVYVTTGAVPRKAASGTNV